MLTCLLLLAFANPDIDATGEGYPRIEVIRGDNGIFHIRIELRAYQGEEEFDILALHAGGENDQNLEVGVIVEEKPNNLLEAWVHVRGEEELLKYALHAYYTVPCPDEKAKEKCRKEYVLTPAESLERGRSE